MAFLRIATNPRAFEYPLSIEEANLIVSDWLQLPVVTILAPGERHWAVLSELLSKTQVRGSTVMDVHLAALEGLTED